MEFPELGDHCSQPNCKQLDFLPVPCSLCNLTFCKDHSSPFSHKCDKQANNVQTTKVSLETYKCSSDGCTASAAIKMLCSKCQKHFCLLHRHHECQEISKNDIEKWRLPKEQFKKVKAETDRKIEEKLQAAKQSSSANSAMVNKIKLMKIKGKAFGDNKIPVIDRIFFSVHPPYSQDIKKESRALFVSKTWTVGRAIDFFSKKMKIENNNNVKDSAKLCLFVKDSGNIVTHKMDVILENLIKDNIIIDGESLVIELVEQDLIDQCTPITISPDKYR